jgi:AraC-like DNA-binding protein
MFHPVLFGALLCFTIARIRRWHLRQDVRIASVQISRKTLFESETLQIGLFEARPGAEACGEVERQSLNAIKHDAPGRHVVGTPALDAGFTSHSHFTARFRGSFGCTPAALRRTARTAEIAELRKIVTARSH